LFLLVSNQVISSINARAKLQRITHARMRELYGSESTSDDVVTNVASADSRAEVAQDSSGPRRHRQASDDFNGSPDYIPWFQAEGMQLTQLRANITAVSVVVSLF
jgi:hypothetical protein